MTVRRSFASALALVFVLSSCSSTTTPTATPRIEPTSISVIGTPSPAIATPIPTPLLSIRDLPHVELADVDATAVCDPEPSQGNVDAGESSIHCTDGLAVAVAVVRTVSQAPVTRLYLHRPPCAAIPCSADESSVAEVTVWTATDAFSIQLDSRLEAVPSLAATHDALWPAAGGEPAPGAARPSISGAPPALSDRDAYPYCGRAELGDQPEVLGCFRDAVLAGRPAEMIQRVYGTEGGEILWIYRYDGQGRLIRYAHDTSVTGDGQATDTWSRTEGAIVLGISPWGWDFDPWSATEQGL